MRHRMSLVCCVALTLTVWTSALAWAADTRLDEPARALLRVGRPGTVIAVGTGTLTLTERGGKNQHTGHGRAQPYGDQAGYGAGRRDRRGHLTGPQP